MNKNKKINNEEQQVNCCFPKTKSLLEKEIKILAECRDGIGKTWNYLKREGIQDEYLRNLYNEFDYKIKEYSLSVEALMEETRRNSVCS
jgi:hypothetical protein